MTKPLVIAILVKSNEITLPLYLNSILLQTEVSKDTIFYIRTNDNNDNTAEILYDFYHKAKHKWKIFMDDSSINPNLINISNHDWERDNRFKIMGDIRQRSVQFAIQENADYFVMDVDNFIYPETLSEIRSTNLPVIAPMLRTCEHGNYSNFHEDTDEHGYYREGNFYRNILNRDILGIFEVPVVHCTYFVKNEVLPYVSYDDNSGRYEYVIFSDSLRKNGIKQYIDNRKTYGVLTFASSEEDLQYNRQYPLFSDLEKYINKSIEEKNPYEIS